MKILIIEDNKDLSSAIETYLLAERYVCDVARTVDSANEKIESYEYDCILLDISLPDGSGFTILEKLKQMDMENGVIIISAKDSLDDKLKGLVIGADDYLTKPFHLAELAMRINALMRRRKFAGNNLIRKGDLSIDLMAKTTTVKDRVVEQLSPKEFQLLLYFVSSANRVLSKGNIAEHLMGENADLLDNFDSVYAHVKNLKKKLKAAECPDYIHTIYGMGYKFNA